MSEDGNIPNVIPSALRQRVRDTLLIASHRVCTIMISRSLPFGRPNERDRQGQVGRVQQPLPASHQAYLILVPAAVAAAENVTGRACASSPRMFFAESVAIYKPGRAFGCEGIVSERLGSPPLILFPDQRLSSLRIDKVYFCAGQALPHVAIGQHPPQPEPHQVGSRHACLTGKPV